MIRSSLDAASLWVEAIALMVEMRVSKVCVCQTWVEGLSLGWGSGYGIRVQRLQ